MRRLFAVAGLLILTACGTTRDAIPAKTVTIPAPYAALAECVYVEGDFGGLGSRFEPLPSMGETRISEHMGFSDGRIIVFRDDGAGGAIVEMRVSMAPESHWAQVAPSLDICAARLASR